jgi:hypothetical protein
VRQRGSDAHVQRGQHPSHDGCPRLGPWATQARERKRSYERDRKREIVRERS